MTRELSPRGNLDVLITVRQRVNGERARGQTVYSVNEFVTWAKRLGYRAGDQLEMGQSNVSGSLDSAIKARWQVRQTAGRRGWQLGDQFTDADGEIWTVGGVQSPRTQGGFVELYCETSTRT